MEAKGCLLHVFHPTPPNLSAAYRGEGPLSDRYEDETPTLICNSIQSSSQPGCGTHGEVFTPNTLDHALVLSSGALMHHMKSSPPLQLPNCYKDASFSSKGNIDTAHGFCLMFYGPLPGPDATKAPPCLGTRCTASKDSLGQFLPKERERETKIRTFKHTQNVTSI